MVKRKGPARVVRFEESARPKTITQAEIAEISMLQAAAFQAEQVMQHALLKVIQRIERGATVEDGPLEFNTRLGMVRTRKIG